MLAFAALIIAFAQPYLPSDEGKASYEKLVPIYLDNSFSMSAKGNNGDLLNQAKTTIGQIVDAYPRGQRYVLVTNALSGKEHRIITKTELFDELETISHSPISRSIDNPLESVKEYLSSTSFSGDLHYYVLSDFQNRNIVNAEAKLDTSATYNLFQIKPQVTHNLFIDSVWFEQAFQRVNTNNALHIRIKNTADKARTNVELNLEVNNTKRQTLADVEANSDAVVVLNYTDKSIGVKAGKVQLRDESLYFDNQFYFSYQVDASIDVLIINDENSSSLPKKVYQTDDFYNIKEVNVGQLQNAALNQADLILLNGIKNISSGLQSQLKQLTDQGVNLLIIPSKEANIGSYNSMLSAFQLPFLNQVDHREIRIGSLATEQSFFKGMFDREVNQLRMPPLKKYFSSTVYNTANFDLLINYENRMPLFISDGKQNNIYMMYSAIESDFNSFGQSALFSSILLRVGEKSQGQTPLFLSLGSSDEYPIRWSKNNESAVKLRQDEIEFIPEMSVSNSVTSISVRNAINNQSIQDGIYDLINAEKEVGKVALNFNRKESDMNYASENEISNYFKSIKIHNFSSQEISNLSDIQQLSLQKPNELWRILLILASMFFLLEMLIIIFWKV